MAHQKKHTECSGGGGAGGPIPAARYLVLLGDVLLVILLHLPELGLQPAQLDLHLLHILQVPLGSLVQHLNGLGHVLDLWRWTDLLDGPTKSVTFIKSLIKAVGIETTQQTFSVLLWLLYFAVIHKLSLLDDQSGASDTWQTGGMKIKTLVFLLDVFLLQKRHKAGTSSIYVFIRCRWIEVLVCVNH